MTRGSGTFVLSDIYNLDYYVQNTGIVAGRNLIIDVLRDCFARGKEFRYERDVFGFPKTPSHQGLNPDAGLADSSTTRLFIGSSYRYDMTYLPAIIVRQTGGSYVPISFNQNKWNIEYERQRLVDGYGNVSYVTVPSAYTNAGAWDQTFDVKVITRSLEDTLDLSDVVMVTLQSTYRDILQQNGLFVRSISAGGENSESTGFNDPMFSLSISVNTRSEWRRSIPISNLVDRVRFCFLFDILNTDVPATGLTITGTSDD